MFMAHHSRTISSTHLLEQNADFGMIEVLLGHSKLDTTEFYTRVATFSSERPRPVRLGRSNGP
jgi:site-specific recombinase XerD